jgi:hypothetical protein
MACGDSTTNVAKKATRLNRYVNSPHTTRKKSILDVAVDPSYTIFF